MKNVSVSEFLDLQQALQKACDARTPNERVRLARAIFDGLTSGIPCEAPEIAKYRGLNQELTDRVNKANAKIAELEQDNRTASAQLSTLAQELAAVKKYRDEREDAIEHMQHAKQAAEQLNMHLGYLQVLVRP